MLSDAQIQDAASRLAAALHPKKIILFGSYARGDATEESDLDLMVVEPEKVRKRLAAMAAGMRTLAFLSTDADVVVYSQEEFDMRADWRSQPVYWANREGKVLYDAG